MSRRKSSSRGSNSRKRNNNNGNMKIILPIVGVIFVLSIISAIYIFGSDDIQNNNTSNRNEQTSSSKREIKKAIEELEIFDEKLSERKETHSRLQKEFNDLENLYSNIKSKKFTNGIEKLKTKLKKYSQNKIAETPEKSSNEKLVSETRSLQKSLKFKNALDSWKAVQKDKSLSKFHKEAIKGIEFCNDELEYLSISQRAKDTFKTDQEKSLSLLKKSMSNKSVSVKNRLQNLYDELSAKVTPIEIVELTPKPTPDPVKNDDSNSASIANAFPQEMEKFCEKLDPILKKHKYPEAVSLIKNEIEKADNNDFKAVLKNLLQTTSQKESLFNLLVERYKARVGTRIDFGMHVKGTLKSSLTEGFEINVTIPGEETSAVMTCLWSMMDKSTLFVALNNIARKNNLLFALSSYCFDAELDIKAHAILREICGKDIINDNIIAPELSFRKQTSIPKDGFAFFQSKWRTPREVQKLKTIGSADYLTDLLCSDDKNKRNEANATIASLCKEDSNTAITLLNDINGNIKDRIRENIKNQPANALHKAWLKLCDEREKAYKIIFDKSIYPDEDHGRVGQPKVDKAVNLVRDIWNNPEKFVSVNKNNNSQTPDALEQAQSDVNGHLGRLGVEVQVPRTNKRESLAERLHKYAPTQESENILKYNNEVDRKNAKFKNKMTKDEYDCVLAHNEYREMMGLRKLNINDLLNKAAKQHSSEMVRLNYYSHTSPVKEYATVGDRAKKVGYRYATLGENIHRGCDNGRVAFDGWYNSSGHHRNMLNKNFSNIGLGQHNKHYTTMFGS